VTARADPLATERVNAHPLIGRDVELAKLKSVMGDPDVVTVVLQGPAGAGKSALAQAALNWAAENGAVTGSGKYPEGEGEAPFEPIILALSDAVAAALDQLYEPRPVADAMRDSLGPALSVLLAAGLNVGVTPSGNHLPPIISRRQRTAQLIDAAVKLVRWLARFDRPIVLVIDDWRRGGAEGESLLSALGGHSPEVSLTLILTERDGLDSGIPRNGTLVPRLAPLRIAVGPLASDDAQVLCEAALGDVFAGGAAVLVTWLGENCTQLPFDILGIATAVVASNALVRIGDGWRIDPALAANLDRTEIANTLAARLLTLPAGLRSLATAAALWGDSAPLWALRLALGIPIMHNEGGLLLLEEVGLLIQQVDKVRFPNDRVRAAILAAWPSSDLNVFAGKIAERLAAAPDCDWPVVGTVALRCRSMGGFDGVDASKWRRKFVDGAKSARTRLDFYSAREFAEAAWRLRSLSNFVEVDEDRQLVREAVLSAADRNDKAEVQRRAHELVRIAVGDLALGEAYEVGISALRLAGDPQAAWAFAKAGLVRFGVTLPTSVNRATVMISVTLWKIERLFHRRSNNPSVVTSVGAFTRISNAAATLAFERSPSMAALLALRGSRRAGRGDSPDAFWLSTDTFLSAMIGDYAEASKLGQRGAELASHPDYDGFAHSATLYRSLYWGPVWTQPQATLRHRCLEVRDLALAEGDLVQAAVALRNWIAIGWRSGASLADLQVDIRQAQRELTLLGDADAIDGVGAIGAAVADATAPLGDKLLSRGASHTLRPPERLIALESAALRGDWYAADHIAPPGLNIGRNLDSHPGGVVWRFHIALAQLKRGRRPRRGDLAFVGRAARLNPTDHAGKALLLEAEQIHCRRGARAALPAFAEAVAAAFNGSSRLEAGLTAEAAEAAARLAGDYVAEERYRARAQQVWMSWGATAKLAPKVADEAMAADFTLNLHEANARAVESERSDRAKSRLLAEVAHELRTPMQAMQSLLDLSADVPQLVDLQNLQTVFGSLTTVINDLTEYGAFSSGGAPLNLAPTNIAELVRSECAVAQTFAAHRGAAVEVIVADRAVEFIEIDGARVRQVLRNLLSNAAKYGGDQIVVTLLRAQHEFAVGVEDNGAGFTESALLSLFEPFQRGGWAGDALGMGLGLSLSRRIATRMGGDLCADNRPAGGARFVFRFPAKIVSPPPTLAIQTIGGLRLLIAEDSELIRQSIGALMRRRGAIVVEVGDGEAALEHLRDGFFDLAIIDLSMPRLGGMELMHRLREGAGGDYPPPIVVLTASSSPDILAAALAAGAKAVLRKPVSAIDLGKVIETLGLANRRDNAAAQGMHAQTSASDSAVGLAAAARCKLSDLIPSLLSSVAAGTAKAADAHLVAGLAAQYGWPAIADACDALELALCASASTSEAQTSLAEAFAEMSLQSSLHVGVEACDEAETSPAIH
jgi:signal transduction histidine kinase/CheY-like chemotaxis protein